MKKNQASRFLPLAMESLDQARWRDLCFRVGLDEEAGTFLRLQRKYGQRHRKYHNARHINDCLARLDESRHAEAGDPLIEYALWFHDAIYSTFSSKNEERSARWATETLRKSRAGRATAAACDLVESLIMATCHGEVPTSPPHQLMVDIDLSILGASPNRFDEYEREIRSEYWWVRGGTYRRKRLAVLQSFARRRWIYSTQEFRERFERQARVNLERSVAKLSR